MAGCVYKISYSDNNKFIIQKRHDLESFNIDDEFIWRSDNLLKGGMFGGTSKCIRKMSECVEQVFKEQILDKECVNNEQVALSLIYRKNPEWFNLIDDNDRKPCKILLCLAENSK